MTSSRKLKPTNPYNFNGQVSELLHDLPLEIQQKLVFQFVDHVVYAPDSTREFPYHLKRLYNTLQSYCKGDADYETVRECDYQAHQASKYDEGFNFIDCQPYYPISPYLSLYEQEMHRLIYWLNNWCLKEEYRTREEMVRIFAYMKHLHASKLARQTCYVRALSLEGENWNSDDASKKNEARKRGHKASQKEAQWQLMYLNDNGISGTKPDWDQL